MSDYHDLPFHYRILAKILSIFPELNTTLGIIVYSAFVYFIYLIILFIHAYRNRDETISRIKDEEEFKKNLAELRKTKSEEANRLLKNLYGTGKEKEN